MSIEKEVLDNYELLDERTILEEDAEHIIEDWSTTCRNIHSNAPNVINLNRHIRIVPAK